MYLIFTAFIVTLLFIYLYNQLPDSQQLLNKRIVANICGWNLLHVVAWWGIAYLLDIKFISDLPKIILLMLVWYALESVVFSFTNTPTVENQEIVYQNPYLPRPDDFIFNFAGVFGYLIWRYS